MIKRYCDKCGNEIDGAAYDVAINVDIVEERNGRQLAVGDYVLQLNFCVDCINKTVRTASVLNENIKKAISNTT